MFELGNSFEYLQKNSTGVIFDMDNQIVLYKAKDNHISKNTLVIFSRSINKENHPFDYAEKIIDIEDLKNSDYAFLFYKNITDKSLKELICKKNKNIFKLEEIKKNWEKIYEKEAFKINLFKSLESYIKYHNFLKYQNNYFLHIKSHYQHKFMGDSHSTTYVKSYFKEEAEINQEFQYKNTDIFSDSYISSLLYFNLKIFDDWAHSHLEKELNETSENFNDSHKLENERKKNIEKAIYQYDAEIHVKTILQEKGLYQIDLDKYPKIKTELSLYTESLISLFSKKLNSLNDKEKLLLQIK